jgi:transcription elongation factor
MAGNLYMDGLFIAQGNPAYVNESVAFAAGQLGKEISLPPTAGSLIPNTYKFVQRKAADGAQNVTGVCFSYDDLTSTTPFTVVGAAAAGKIIAGVWLGDDDATDVLTRGMQAGNYGFLQVGGIATCLSGAAVSAGETVCVAPGTNNKVIKVDWATGAATQQVIGVAVTAAGGGDTAFKVLLSLPRPTL